MWTKWGRSNREGGKSCKWKSLLFFHVGRKRWKVRWRHESKEIVKTGNEWVSTGFPLSRLKVLGSIHLKDLLLCSKANSTMSPINTSLDYQLISPRLWVPFIFFPLFSSTLALMCWISLTQFAQDNTALISQWVCRLDNGSYHTPPPLQHRYVYHTGLHPF